LYYNNGILTLYLIRTKSRGCQYEWDYMAYHSLYGQ
jgi:hypothetical protein